MFGDSSTTQHRLVQGFDNLDSAIFACRALSFVFHAPLFFFSVGRSVDRRIIVWDMEEQVPVKMYMTEDDVPWRDVKVCAGLDPSCLINVLNHVPWQHDGVRHLVVQLGAPRQPIVKSSFTRERAEVIADSHEPMVAPCLIDHCEKLIYS